MPKQPNQQAATCSTVWRKADVRHVKLSSLLGHASAARRCKDPIAGAV